MTNRILIVDDSRTQRLTLKMKLEKRGYDVFEAEDGMDGIKQVYEYMPDLILSDVIMPNLNGYHLCRLVKRDKITQNIPFVLLTVLDKKIDKFWGLRVGADAFCRKDGDDDELVTTIENLIEINKSKNIEKFRIEDTSQYDFTAKVADILDESLVKSTLTNEFRELAEFVIDEKVFNNKLMNLLCGILDFNLMAVFYNDSDKRDKIVHFTQNECDVSSEVLKDATAKILNKIIYTDYNYSRLKLEYKIVTNEENQIDYPQNIENLDAFQSQEIVPLMNEGKLIGALALFHKMPNKYLNSNTLEVVLSELKLVMKIRWLYSETKLLSTIDPLTELFNRRYFQQVLDKEFLRSNRYSNNLSLAMIDIDNFKKLNDTYGHLFGDEVLQVISRLFQESLRKTDYVARYGGEELIAVLPETAVQQAIIPIERLRNKIQDYMFSYDNKRVNVTVSIGLAQNNFEFVSTDEFIKAADNALYEAKEKGKNRIELAPLRKSDDRELF